MGALALLFSTSVVIAATEQNDLANITVVPSAGALPAGQTLTIFKDGANFEAALSGADPTQQNPLNYTLALKGNWKFEDDTKTRTGTLNASFVPADVSYNIVDKTAGEGPGKAIIKISTYVPIPTSVHQINHQIVAIAIGLGGTATMEVRDQLGNISGAGGTVQEQLLNDELRNQIFFKKDEVAVGINPRTK